MSKVIANIRLFFQGAVLSYIALFAWFRPSQYIATKVVGPLAQILFFTLMGKFGTAGESADFYIIGNAIQITALSGIFGVTFSIAGDRWNGTLPYLFGTPANRMTMFLGRAVIHVIDGIFGVLIGFAWGVTLLGLDLSNTDPWALLLVIAVTTFSTSGLGLLLGSLSLITRNAQAPTSPLIVSHLRFKLSPTFFLSRAASPAHAPSLTEPLFAKFDRRCSRRSASG
jgi:ABC-2 type transport system permease protein